MTHKSHGCAHSTVSRRRHVFDQRLVRLRRLGAARRRPRNRRRYQAIITGYSSLSYPRRFAIDFLKINKSFVYNLESDAASVALCEAIIVMAHKLGLLVIAEGVKTRQQADLRGRAGCNFGQGVLFGQAMPAPQFETMLKN